MRQRFVRDLEKKIDIPQVRWVPPPTIPAFAGPPMAAVEELLDGAVQMQSVTMAAPPMEAEHIEVVQIAALEKVAPEPIDNAILPIAPPVAEDLEAAQMQMMPQGQMQAMMEFEEEEEQDEDVDLDELEDFLIELDRSPIKQFFKREFAHQVRSGRQPG